MKKKIHRYKVRESRGLFGDFCRNDCSDTLIAELTPKRAVERYMKRYRIKYKERNEHERSYYEDTSRKWATIRVESENGFRYYFF